MPYPKIPAEERFAAKYRIDEDSGCWLWTASIRPNGYTQFARQKGEPGYGHRFSYELHVGPIPAGMHLHHLCGVRSCVNPEHLELVTPAEHVRADDTLAGRNARKTHCKRDHPLSGDNLYVNPTTGKRSCRTCMKEWREAHREDRRTYSREYWRRRYKSDPEFRAKFQQQSRDSMQKRRAEAKGPNPPLQG